MPSASNLLPGGLADQEPALNASGIDPGGDPPACDLLLRLGNLAAFGDACGMCAGGVLAPIPRPGYARSSAGEMQTDSGNGKNSEVAPGPRSRGPSIVVSIGNEQRYCRYFL